MVNKFTKDLNNILWYNLLSYKLLFTKGKIELFYLLNLGVFQYFYTVLSFQRRSIESKNWHDHRAILNSKCHLCLIHTYEGYTVPQTTLLHSCTWSDFLTNLHNFHVYKSYFRMDRSAVLGLRTPLSLTLLKCN